MSQQAPKKENAKNAPAGAERTTLFQEIMYLLIKLAMILVVLAAVFTFLFGALRYNNDNMASAFREGDLVLFYRLDKRYAASESLVMKYEGEWMVQRVVAVAGDTVDITEEGLLVNDAIQQESHVYTETERYESDVEFPLTVKEGEVFVLSDNRENATDGRVFGPVRIKDTYGKVTAIFRRRNL